MHENRETPWPTAGESGSPAGEGESRTTGTHGNGESDGAIVPMKPSNKAAGEAPEAAERVEGRAPTKENVLEGTRGSGTARSSRVTGSDGRTDSRSAVGRYSSQVRAVCVNRARTDLCGGCEATRIPTATSSFVVCQVPGC